MAARKQFDKKHSALLNIAVQLLYGETFTYDRLQHEHGLSAKTARRYLNDLRDAGLPLEQRGDDWGLSLLRTRLDVEAVDVTASSAKSLSLLLVAAALLPKNLGIRDAVDDTVRQALRLRGQRLSTEMRRYEGGVVLLENEAKDYTGREDIFDALFDAVLNGACVELDYWSPRRPRETRRMFPATLGLYRGGVYVLGVDVDDDGDNARWWALERLEDVPIVVGDELLSSARRLKAVASAARRWGPAAPKAETLVTLHFSKSAAPYVRARPWHTAVDAETWDDGGLRVSIRLSGETTLFENWLMSWGAAVQVLRPLEMAERLAAEMEKAAAQHRSAAAEMQRFLDED